MIPAGTSYHMENPMKELELFRSVAGDPYGYAGSLKEKTGKKIIGTLCSYAPEEIITAAGAVPFRIFGGKEQISRADAHLQPYACSLVRGALEDALGGFLGFLDGTVFPHTCDSIQRLSDIWRLNAGCALHYDVVMPVKLYTESARDYMRDVMERFRADLGKGLGKEIRDDDLRASIALYNGIRENLSRIYNARRDDPGIISDGDLHAVMKAAMVMDRTELAVKLAELASALSGAGPAAMNGNRRIFLSGGLCNHPSIYGIINESGGTVVGDDLCTGARYFQGTIAAGGDPITAIASRYTDRIVCPAKHRTNTARGDELLRSVKDAKAAGVIFILLKFCDPHAFDYPYLKEYLDGAGVPSMLLEIEEQLPPEGQLRTRLETFMSTL